MDHRRPTFLHLVHSLSDGGTERTLVELLHRFDRARMRHVVVTLRSAGRGAARLPDHVSIQPINAQGRSWTTSLVLSRLSRRWGAALIHARNTGCWPDAILAHLLTPKSKLVLGFHGLETAAPFSRRQRRWISLALRIGGRFTVVSAASARQLHEQAAVPMNRIALLRNGVDLTRFAPVNQETRTRGRMALGFKRDEFVIGTVGSLTSVKRQSELIRAISNLIVFEPSVRLLIVGEGPLEATLREQATLARVADRVLFTGRREDVPDVMNCMDVYVCSSASEGMSNALLEALAVGLPIVTTRSGDPDTLVRDGVEGCRVGAGSGMSMTEALLFLIRQSTTRRAFAVAARVRACRYDFSQTVKAYESFYLSYQALRRVPHRAADLSPRGFSNSVTPRRLIPHPSAGIRIRAV